MRERLTGTAYALGWAVVKRLPEPAARALFRIIADAAWLRRGRGVLQLEANLRRVVGWGAPAPAKVQAQTPARVRALSRAAMRSYLRYWCEVFRLPVWGADRVVARIVLHDEPVLRAAMARGRGVVVVLPHCANWDHAGAWAAVTGLPLVTVAERLRPEGLYDRFVAYRESLGMEVLALGDRAVFGVLARRLRAGGLVCLLGDRDLTAGGVGVTFFGEPATMPGGPAALALATGAELIPATLWYDGTRLHVRIHPPVERPGGDDRQARTAAMTQTVAHVFERAIAKHPEDWHMLQRLWRADVAASAKHPEEHPGARPDGHASGRRTEESR